MPRLRASRPRRARGRLTADQAEDLLYGASFAGPGGAFGSAAARRVAWFMHRAALLQLWELQDPPAGQEYPQALIDFEDPSLGYPPARKVRGLRVLTREMVRGQTAQGG